MKQTPESKAIGEKTSPAKPALTVRALLTPAAMIIAAAALIVWLLWGDDSLEESAPAQQDSVTEEAADDAPTEVAQPEQPDLSELERHDPEDPLAIGEVNAPVTLIVFSDYQCPYCSAWSEETLPSMMEYVEAGKMRIEWRDLNVFGPASVQASRAAYAAALQDKFWEYHHQLFPDGEHLSEDQLSSEALVGLAEEIGLDAEQFSEDMNSGEVEEQVDENAELGYSIGAYSTPTFIVGGTPMVGAQPTEVFTQAVDDALADTED